MSPRDVVVFAELDWDGLHCQSHVIALGMAARGHRVLYVNRTLQRWPTIDHLRRRLRKSTGTGAAYCYAERPSNLDVVTLLHVPPVRALRGVNTALVRRQLSGIGMNDPVMIIYVPSYLALDVASVLGVGEYHYVCYHNFDADKVLPDLLRSEREIVTNARTVFADSEYLRARLARMSGGRNVHASEPGVYYELFAQSYRGDEAARCRRIAYFGGIGPHLNIPAYNALAERHEVLLIGIVDAAIRRDLSPRIVVQAPVPNRELPGILRDVDVIALLYRDSAYMRGVIPAKFYECLATGKPILVSGLEELDRFRDIVYVAGEDPEQVCGLVAGLDPGADVVKSRTRQDLAIHADWSHRVRDFYETVFPGVHHD
jgi:hypothetical protein